MINYKLLGLDGAPYGVPSFKCDVMGIGTAISGGAQAMSNLTTGMAQVQAQYDANQKNLQAVQETNAQNKELAEKQLEQYWKSLLETEDFNRSERIAEQNYNSPVHQAELLKAAGLNPALMLGSGKGSVSGASISQGSLPAAAQMQAASQDPVDYSLFNKFGESLTSIFPELLASEKLQAETDAIHLDNREKSLLMSTNVAKALEDLKGVRADNETKRFLNDLNAQTRDSQIEQFKIRNSMMNQQINESVANTALISKNALMQDENMKWLGKLNQSRLDLDASMIASNFARAAESKANIESAFASAQASLANAMLANAQANKVNLDYDTAKETAKFIVGNAALGYFNNYYSPESEYSRKLHEEGGKKSVHGFGNFVGGLIGRGLNFVK